MCFLFTRVALLVIASVFALDVSAAATNTTKPDLLTGNLSVGYLRWMIGGRKGDEPKPWLAAYLAQLRRDGVNGIEDYITFAALEPEEGKPDWHYYARNCEMVRAAGMRYGVYPWLHFAPKWFTNSAEYTPYLCLEHGLPTDSTSIWAPGTLRMYDRFYAQLRVQFGDKVSDIHASMPADYGEVGFPVGMSSWVVPQEHKHAGFWCGDHFARADFGEKMRKRYNTIEAANRAWGTGYRTWDAVDYPPLRPPETNDGAARRRWLDFVGWYADSQTEFTSNATTIIRKHFPTTPIQVKLGYGGEDIRYGVDNTAIMRMAAKQGVIVRSTHGKLPAFFYKRFSTPAGFYHAALLTEPPSEVSRDEEVTRIFNDAGNLSTAYFDYPQNIFDAADLFDAYLPWVEGEPPYIRVAFMFPTSDHRLRNGQVLPPRLRDQADPLRDITDYDLVDENLVRDGVLKQHQLLVLFEGNWFEQQTLDAIAAWVRNGGTLLLNDSGPMANIAGETTTWRELMGPLASRTGDDSVLTTTSTPRHMLLDIGAEEDSGFLGSGWWSRDGTGKGTRRWTKEKAEFSVPVEPAGNLVVTVFASGAPFKTNAAHLHLNGRDLGELAFKNGAAAVRVSAKALDGRRRALFTIVAPTWRPSERVPGNKDSRLLGIWVDRIDIAQENAAAIPSQPAPRFELDTARWLREFSRPFGKGKVLFFPLGAAADRGFRDALEAAIYRDGHPIHPSLDTEFDGVQTALLKTKILILNPTDRPISKSVQLSASEFAGVPGPTPPDKQLNVELPPHSIRAIRRSDGVVLSPRAQDSRSLEDLNWWMPNPDIAQCEVKDGVLRVRTEGKDPQLQHGRPFGVTAKEWHTLVLHIRTDIPGARLYWTTDLHPKMTDATNLGFTLPADGAWHDVRVDLRKAAQWEGVVRRLRFDLEGRPGFAEFSAIRLEPDSD